MYGRAVSCMCPTGRCHLTLTSFSWFRCYSSFCVLICFSYTICNRSTKFGVWNDCKVYMFNCQISSDLDIIFMLQWSKLSFWILVFFSNTICNRSTIFGVWKCFMMNMSVSQVLFDLDLIFTVHCLVLILCVLVCFS